MENTGAEANQTEVKAKIIPEQFSWSKWYDKNYKLLMIIPTALIIIAFIFIIFFAVKNNDVFNKDVTLTGGTTIVVYTEKPYSASEIENALKGNFNDIIVRILTDISSGKQIAFSVETKAEPDALKKSIEEFTGFQLDESNSSTEFTGTALSKSFSNELIIALLLAFLFMSIVVFILFKTPLPCAYMITCAFADIIVPMAAVDYFGLKISTAGIAAFLMLVGYSVDSDILLTTRVLKRKNDVLNKRIFSSMKTGMTMTLTSFVSVFIAYFIVISPILKQVFLILTIGLVTDMIVTWTLNAGLLKWYCDKRGMQ